MDDINVQLIDQEEEKKERPDGKRSIAETAEERPEEHEGNQAAFKQ